MLKREKVSPGSQTAPKPSDDQRRAVSMKRVIIIGIAVCAAIIGLYSLYVLYYFQIRPWQILAVAGWAMLSLICLVIASFLVRRKKLDAAGYWLLASVVVGYGGNELVLANATLHITVGGILLILLVGSAVLPRRWSAWLTAAGLLGAWVWLVNRFEPLPRYDMTQSVLSQLNIIPITTALVAMIILWQSLLAYRRTATIGARLLNASVLVVLLPAAVIIAFSALMGLQSGRRQVLDQLESVATLKEAEIEMWVDRLQSSLSLAVAEQEATWAAEALLQEPPASAGYQAAYNGLQERLGQVAKHTQLFEELFLMDAQGRTVLSTDAAQEGKIHRQQTYFRKGLAESYVQPPFYSPSLDRMSVIVVRPVVDEQGHTLGVLAGRASMAALNEIMLERAGFGETGETYLVGSNRALLSGSRFAAQEEGVELYVRTEGANAASIAHVNGSGLYENYQGLPVAGVYHWLPELQVGLLAEQRQSEAFRSIYTMLRLNGGVAIVCVLLAAVAALFVTRSIAVPLADLAATAGQIAAGDLELAAKVEREDEIGALAQAFNSMTARLREMIGSLEQHVAELERAEERIKHLNTVLRAIRNVNQLITRVKDRDGLLRGACDSLVETRGYHSVWIAILDEPGGLVTTAEAGWDQDFAPLVERLKQGLLTDCGQMALRQAAVVVTEDPASNCTGCPLSVNCGGNGAMTIRLEHGGRGYGLMSVSTPRDIVADEAEQALFKEVAEDIAFALHSMEQEEALRDERRMFIGGPTVVFKWIAREGWPVEYVSPNVLCQFGYTVEDFTSGKVLYADIVHPDDLERVAGEVRNHSESGVPSFEQEYRIVRADGEYRWLYDFTVVKRDDSGNITHYQGYVHDITERKRAEDLVRRRNRELTLLNRVIAASTSALDVEQVLQITCRELAQAFELPQAAAALLNAEGTQANVVAEYLAPGRPSGLGNIIPITGNPGTEYVLEHKKPLAVADAQTDERMTPVRDLMRERGTVSLLIVPLLAHGKVVGTLGLDAIQRREFSEEEITLAQNVAAAVGQALEAAQLHQALQRHVKRLEILHEVDRAILAAQSPETIAQAALDRIRQLVPCQRASVVEFDLQAGQATVLAVHTNGETQLEARTRLPLKQYGPIEELEQGQVRVVEDILSLSQPLHTDRALLAEGLRSYVTVPLVARDELIGALNLGASRPGTMAPEHLGIACEVANQLAVAIQNARLYQIEQKQRERAEALRQAAQAMGASLSLDEILRLILDQLKRVLIYDTASVLIFREGNVPDLVVGVGYADEQMVIREAKQLLGDSPILRQMARDLQPVVSADVRQLDGWILVPGAEHIRSWLGAPLVIRGQMIGALMVDSTRLGFFGPAEAQIAQTLAQHAAQAIENARLYRQARLHAEELSDALAQLQEMDRLKSEFIQNVSHELRTPLALIQGYVELLMTGELGQLGAQQQEPMEIIARWTRMLSSLVDDIVLILEIEARSPVREPIALDELARSAIEDFRVAAQRAQLTLTADIAPDLPPVVVEALHVRRVLANLLSNALKFTPAGGAVSVRVWREDDQVILQVADTGIGIPPEQQTRIFERFYQVDGSIRRRYGGVGLGLALVQELVEAHGGRITVESEVGRGSAFTVTLPVHSA